MARRLELDELVEHFTLLADEAALLRNKSGATRLGFALLLKFFTRMGRVPIWAGRGVTVAAGIACFPAGGIVAAVAGATAVAVALHELLA